MKRVPDRHEKALHATLAFLIVATVVLCPFVTAMKQCVAVDTMTTVCLVIVAVITEVVALGVIVSPRLSFKPLCPTAMPFIVKIIVTSIWPPGLRETSFLTPLRI